MYSSKIRIEKKLSALHINVKIKSRLSKLKWDGPLIVIFQIPACFLIYLVSSRNTGKNQKTDYFHCNCAIIVESEYLKVTASFIFYIAAKGKNKEKTKHKFLIAIFHWKHTTTAKLPKFWSCILTLKVELIKSNGTEISAQGSH